MASWELLAEVRVSAMPRDPDDIEAHVEGMPLHFEVPNTQWQCLELVDVPDETGVGREMTTEMNGYFTGVGIPNSLRYVHVRNKSRRVLKPRAYSVQGDAAICLSRIHSKHDLSHGAGQLRGGFGPGKR